MGLRDVLRQAKQAINADAIKQGLDAARNPVSQDEIDARLATLSPEQRAAYDANMASVDAAAQVVRDEEAVRRVLDGPAGDFLYGPKSDDVDAAFADGGIGAVLQMSKDSLAQSARSIYRVGAGGPVETDPVRAAGIAAAERAERDRLRAPYLPPDRPLVSITRLATTGETQIADVAAFLRTSGLGARPDLVFGVYRVPDRIRPARSPASEGDQLVEWDVVHAGLPGQPVEVPVAAAFLGAHEQWVARRKGEPSVLDEDLGIVYLEHAGIGAEACLGIARVGSFVRPKDRWYAFDLDGANESYAIVPQVEGIAVFHAGVDDHGVLARMADAAPLAVGPESLAGTHTAILNWNAVRRAVHPKVHHPPQIPSPFPYLPSTPQELLSAYLEVVGVRAADSLSAQATIDAPFPLVGEAALGSSTFGPKQPCADGVDRRRLHGCHRIVVTYRDRPEYVEGRDRWNRYQTEVLLARLERMTRVRPPVEVDELPGNAVLRAGARALNAYDKAVGFGEWKPPPYRYCWPPVD